jgi:hypothetical protein
MQYASDGEIHNIGVLVYNAATRLVHYRFRQDYGFVPQEEQYVLSLVGDDIANQLKEFDDAITLIEHLEDTLSNTIRISDRTPIAVDRDPAEIVESLYSEHVAERDSYVSKSETGDNKAASK